MMVRESATALRVEIQHQGLRALQVLRQHEREYLALP